MSTIPKPDSPRRYWLDVVAELQAILDPTDVRYDQVLNLMYFQDMELLDVRSFCSVEPGNPSDLTLADLEDTNYALKYLQAAKQAAFYKLCQDTPEGDLLYAQTVLDAEDLHELMTGGDLFISGVESGVDDEQIISMSLTWVPNTTQLSGTGTFKVKLGTQSDFQATADAALITSPTQAYTVADIAVLNGVTTSTNGQFTLTFEGAMMGTTDGKLVINLYYVQNLRGF